LRSKHRQKVKGLFSSQYVNQYAGFKRLICIRFLSLNSTFNSRCGKL